MDRKLQRHRADSLRQHGFLVIESGCQWLTVMLYSLDQALWLSYLLS